MILENYNDLSALHGHALRGTSNIRTSGMKRVGKNPYSVVSDIVNDFVMVTTKNEINNLAREIVREIKRIIRSQSLTWKPLSPSYVRRKRRLGWDSRILIATQQYINAIRAWVDESQEDKDRRRVFIGVTGTHTVTINRRAYTVSMVDLANWLEFGTTRMAARPHWRPVMSKFRTEANQRKKQLRNKLNDVLDSRLEEEFK